VTQIAIVGDTHFGVRGDNLVFHDLNEQFYSNVFFPEIKKRNIEWVIQTGDLFDRPKFTNHQTLSRAKNYFFNKFTDIKLITYIGNHDKFFKNTLELNSPDLLLSEYSESSKLLVIKTPTTRNFDGVDVDFIPWICPTNEQEIKEFIKKSRSQICFGHFELSGFEMDAGNPCLNGMSREVLSGYDMVISGHFHHRSSDGHIFYVGSPCEFTWADYDDPRGFHIFDTHTRQLEFIVNPYKMFYKIEYDDSKETLNSIDNKDYCEFKNKFVKVVVKTKNNLTLFDRFINNFYQAEPADLNIVENFTDYKASEDLMEEDLDQAEHTHILLDKYLDAVDLPVDKAKMKSVMRKLYNDAYLQEKV